MDIVAIAVSLFIYIFLLELSLTASEAGSARFWAFLCMVMAFVLAGGIWKDNGSANGAISYGTTKIFLNLPLEFGLFVLVLIPAMRIYSTRNP